MIERTTRAAELVDAQNLAIEYWLSIGREAAKRAASLTAAQRIGGHGSRDARRERDDDLCALPDTSDLREAMWAAELAQRKLAVARWRGIPDGEGHLVAASAASRAPQGGARAAA